MARLGRFSRELRGRLWQPAVDEEVRREFEHHLEMLERDLIAGGMDPAAARRAARAKFGDATRFGDECVDIGQRRDRDAERSEWLAELGHDVRYALRQVRASPGFSLIAVLTLAVGLGATTTIFGIADAVLLRPFPGTDPDRLVIASEQTPIGQSFAVSEPDYLDWRQRTSRFAGMAAFAFREPVVTSDERTETVVGAAVAHSFFPVIGVRPLLGRTFNDDEDVPGGDTHVAVIAHGFWQRFLGGDPAVLQQSLTVDGVRRRIIGVLPPGFAFPERVEVWTPLAPNPSYHRGDRRLFVIARLAPGITIEQGREDLTAVARQIAVEYPSSNAGWSARLAPFSEWFIPPRLERRVIALLVAVGLLLAMACVNVASLLLARAGARHREIAVRTALGAGRRRIVRQLLTESLVLSHLGAALGIVATAIAIPVIRRMGSTAIWRLEALSFDWRMLAFAYAACLATGMLFGLAPALQVSGRGGWQRASGLDALRTGSRTVAGGRVRSAMIVTSVALAMLLLVCAGLVGGSFMKLMQVPLGFSPERVLTASITLPPRGQDDEGDRITGFYGDLAQRLRALPGVRAVGAINIAPFSGGSTAMEYRPAGRAEREGEHRLATWRVVTPEFFDAVQLPLIRGRLFEDGDRQAAPYVTVINQTMARIGWPGVDPVGQRVDLDSELSMTIVGVVGDSRLVFADSLPPPTMYFPHDQFRLRAMWLAIRTSGDPLAIVDEVQREVAALHPGLALARVQPLTQLVRDTTAEPRLTVLVFAIFATAAMVLAAIGLYGMISYSVTQRTREIGVRVALGASPRRIVRAVVTQGLRLGALGVALGGTAAYGAVGALRSILFETEPTDPATFVAIGGMLLLIAALASVVPAARAARVDPLTSLRTD